MLHGRECSESTFTLCSYATGITGYWRGAESLPAKPEKLRDTLQDEVKAPSSVAEHQDDNPYGGHAKCETLIGAKAGARAPTRQGSRQRTSRQSNKVEGTPKRMRMTEVEKLKTNLHETKGRGYSGGAKRRWTR